MAFRAGFNRPAGLAGVAPRRPAAPDSVIDAEGGAPGRARGGEAIPGALDIRFAAATSTLWDCLPWITTWKTTNWR